MSTSEHHSNAACGQTVSTPQCKYSRHPICNKIVAAYVLINAFCIFRQLFEKYVRQVGFYCANKWWFILSFIKHLFTFHTDFSCIFQPRISCAIFSSPVFSCPAFFLVPHFHVSHSQFARRMLGNARLRSWATGFYRVLGRIDGHCGSSQNDATCVYWWQWAVRPLSASTCTFSCRQH